MQGEENPHDMAKVQGITRRDENNCRRKIAYETVRDAKLRAKLVRQLIHEMVLAYRCPLSYYRKQPHWHIGHPQQLNGLSWNDARSGKYEDE